MACGCKGLVTTIVQADRVDEWRCRECRRPGRPTGHTVVLGDRGALPNGWRDPPLCATHLLVRCVICEANAAA
jgi:hypothetical protein